jgi:Methyltransferase domain
MNANPLNRLARRAAKRARNKLGRAVRQARKELRRTPKRVRRLRRASYRLYNTRYRRTYTHTLAYVPARDELPAVLRSRRLLGRGVEVGVKLGKFSDFLLARWPGEKLISVDPWLAAGPDDYVDHANVSQDEHERSYRETCQRLAKYGDRSEIWRQTSLQAADQIEDGTLDFVYLDARHDYESVKEDLEAWFPKVRAGGIVAGHDYADGSFPSGDFGVKRAVDEFFARLHLPVFQTRGSTPVEMFPTWLVEVPTANKDRGSEAA